MSILVIKVIERHYFDLVLNTLNQQTIANQIELIIIVEDEANWLEIDKSVVSNIGVVRPLIVGPIDNNDLAMLEGVKAASTDIVVYGEDHAYYTPDWGHALVEAHAEGWTAVCTRMFNANPKTFWSWVNFISAFGPWAEGDHYGQVDDVSRHNGSYLRKVLLKYDQEELVRLFPRGGSLHKQLRQDGAKFYLTKKGSLAHVNASLMKQTILLRIKGGQLKAALRADRRGWSYPLRIVFAAAAPVFPPIRFFRRYGHMIKGRRFQGQRLKIIAAYAVGLSLEAIGNAFGFLFGPANTAAFLAVHETGRFKEITEADYNDLFRSDSGPLYPT